MEHCRGVSRSGKWASIAVSVYLVQISIITGYADILLPVECQTTVRLYAWKRRYVDGLLIALCRLYEYREQL